MGRREGEMEGKENRAFMLMFRRRPMPRAAVCLVYSRLHGPSSPPPAPQKHGTGVMARRFDKQP